MASKRKVIITSAVTGAIHTPTMSPHLPVTSEEIADAAIGAAEAGAAIVHMHARDPKDGRPSQDPEHFEPILDKLKANTDAVINITTGGSPHMSVEERMLPVATFKPELASLNMGSMNFGLYPMLDRYPEFQHEWEREGLEKSRDLVFKNTFADIETILDIGNGNGTRFEFECYDISHLNNLAHFHGRGLARGPLFVQSVFGLLGGHRRTSRGPDAHAPHRRPGARRRLPVVYPGCRQEPNAAGHHRRGHGLARARWLGGLAVDRPRATRRVQCGTGYADPHDPRGAELRSRQPGRSPRDVEPQGPRKRRILISTMKILIAPDSFKGTYTANEVAANIASGVRAAGGAAVELPVADGGEGTYEILRDALNAELVDVDTVGPWRDPLRASYALASDGTAVIGLAAASGITLPCSGERSALTADTYGTGLLMADAASRGATRIVVAAGGSATTDGGTGRSPPSTSMAVCAGPRWWS